MKFRDLLEGTKVTSSHVLKYMNILKKAFKAKDYSISDVGSKGEWTVEFKDSNIGNIVLVFKNIEKSNKNISSANLIAYSTNGIDYVSIPDSINSMNDLIKNYKLLANMKGTSKSLDRVVKEEPISFIKMSGNVDDLKTDIVSINTDITNIVGWYFNKFNKDIDTHVGTLDCSNSGITSLVGLPDGFNSELYCHSNKLTSLDGLPKGFNSELYCYDNKLTSLNGLPDGFNSYLDCFNNKLTNLDGLPNGFNSLLNCSYNQLTSLNGLPDGFNSYLDCFNNKLTSLIGLPDEFNSYLDCSYNKLTSLIGLPDDFNSKLDCHSNKLKSLEGLPEGFNSKLDCSGNELTSLKGITNLDIDNLVCDWTTEHIEKEYKILNLKVK